MSERKTPDMSNNLVQLDGDLLDLSHKRKFSETVIQFLLLVCGVLSIFTTIGIVIVLGKESICFFTCDQWVNTNRALLVDINESDSTFEVQPGLHDADPGELMRMGNEVMRIQEFQNNIINNVSIGSGAGFTLFCASDEMLAEQQIERPTIANASRAINADETATCNANGLNPVEFRVGTDALAVVVSADNDFLTQVTTDELKAIFGTAELWSDISSDFPDEPIQLIIPGEDSGTFDYFVEELFDGDSSVLVANEGSDVTRINDVITSENDNQLVGAISRDPYSIGFFGYAYYLENSDDLTLLTIDGIMPGADTVDDGSYSLSRPLFIYSDPQIMQDQPHIASFIDYYLTHINEVIDEVGYFPASDEALEEARQNWMSATGLDAMEDIDPATVAGHIETAGSSTVFPISEAIKEIFVEAGFVPRLTVERGIRPETPAVPHKAGISVELDDRPTLVEFFTTTSWIPAIGQFGVLPLINATLMTSVIAMLVALPLGLGAAVYLSEYATPRVRNTLKPVLEILAGIPTVVYGYFALTFMTPLLRAIFGIEVVNIYNTASAGIVIGILTIPLVSSMAEDALHAVPVSLREASYGLGATKLETVVKVVIPAGLSGILAAFIVAASRAIGETMIVAIAAGAGPNFTFNPFDSAETMTGHIARISGGDLSYDSIDYNSIFAIGLTLFIMTFLLNALSRTIISRFREAY